MTSLGPYTLLGKPRTGGTAEVFQARDTRTGTLVALKRLLPRVTEDEDLRVSIEEEARLAATLDHPNIARLLEATEIEGRFTLAYECVEGRDLRAIFEHASSREPLSLSFLLPVFLDVGSALAHAHGKADPIVHRDVSPQNIIVSFEGTTKLIDFGIAKAKGSSSRTGAGVIKGKLGYTSPEQVRGAPLDARTDVFSLGICLWELLTRQRLFAAADEIRTLDRVKHHMPEPPSAHRADVRPELDWIVMKALAKDPDERYGSARLLTEELRVFSARSGYRADRDRIAESMRDWFGDENGSELVEPTVRSTGRIMELQESRMSDDNKGGSDLDIFEGLGKKGPNSSPAKTAGAVPPPPPGSGAHVAAKPGVELKKTLMGIPGPAQMPAQPPQPPSQSQLPAVRPASPSSAARPSGPPASPEGSPRPSAPPPLPPASGSMRAAAPVSQPPAAAPSASKPPPPPGRGSLPNLAATQPSQPPVAAAPSTSPSATQKSAPPPPSTRPTALASNRPVPAAPASSQPNGGKLDMDWDDDNEATHVFDKEKNDKEKAAAAKSDERADMDAILSSPPRTSAPPIPAAGTPPPPPPSTLSGAFGNLNGAAEGRGEQAPRPSASFKSGPPASQSLRSAPPPPPPGSMKNPSTTTAPIPPPPPGSPTTSPMHLPPRPPAGLGPQMQGGGGGMHQSVSNYPSAPPAAQAPVVQAQPQAVPMPQVHRMPPSQMEATALVPRPRAGEGGGGKAGLFAAIFFAVLVVVGGLVFFMMGRSGTLVVNVADAKGAPVDKLEVYVDGAKKCDSAPCILHDVPSGVHEVKVTASGYELVAARAVTVGRVDAKEDFTLVPSKTAGGTGFKVVGNQPGVKLYVDGKEVGTLPQEVRDLEPGDHKLHFVGSERYAPLDKNVTVGKDEIVDLGPVQLKVLKGKATITLGTPGAKVYLVNGTNRKEVPQFPIAIDFDPNEKWQLEAKMIGYDDLVQPITWDDGQAEKTINVTLSAKGTGGSKLAANSPPAAAAPVNPGAAAPPKGPAVAPPAPKDEPKDEPADKPTAKVDPKKGGDAPANAGGGGDTFLNINSLPASTVVLDGKPLGPTPRVKVAVSPGAHTILFVNAEQSLKKSITVNVGAGETKAAFAKLRD